MRRDEAHKDRTKVCYNDGMSLYPHQEGSAHPGEGGDSGKVRGLLQHAQFALSDLRHFVFEGQLPRVQLQHLDAVQHLVHQLYPVVFALHLCNLQKGNKKEIKIMSTFILSQIHLKGVGHF